MAAAPPRQIRPCGRRLRLLFITVPLKRGADTRCVDEVARSSASAAIKFETRCGDEVYELDYALANDVVAKSVTLKADARGARDGAR